MGFIFLDLRIDILLSPSRHLTEATRLIVKGVFQGHSKPRSLVTIFLGKEGNLFVHLSIINSKFTFILLSSSFYSRFFIISVKLYIFYLFFTLHDPLERVHCICDTFFTNDHRSCPEKMMRHFERAYPLQLPSMPHHSCITLCILPSKQNMHIQILYIN